MLIAYALLSVVFKAETTNLGEYGPYEVISVASSPNGFNWGFVARKADGNLYVIANGKRWGPYEWAYSPSFSSDGSVWGFSVKKPGGKWYVIINGQEHGPYAEVSYPEFSSDGSAVFYAARETKQSYYRIERVKVSK